ncbi:MAG TPA: AbrB/MazE/SpoVT family DNA-binding domain-containing protein [Kofleriaceae bacterium]|nr:AbrB/MazE/SpoVT family DNA-binding domain-containing protein [Kofleriaceae bacterium]
MTKNLRQIGNSYGIIIDKAILELLNIGPETDLEITTDGKRLMIEPVAQPTSKREAVKAAHAKAMKKYDTAFKRLAK